VNRIKLSSVQTLRNHNIK